MQEKFKDQLELRIYTSDAKEAAAYPLKGSTNVFVNQAWVGLDVATSMEKMEAYLAKVIADAGDL